MQKKDLKLYVHQTSIEIGLYYVVTQLPWLMTAAIGYDFLLDSKLPMCYTFNEQGVPNELG
jgi:hypothetical protein